MTTYSSYDERRSEEQEDNEDYDRRLALSRNRRLAISRFILDSDSSDDDDDFIIVMAVQGNSVMRDFLVDKIKSNALSRPAYNLRRNSITNN